jgi:regulator of protease activity HflC (stomatin/prohibitin superfamily)
LRAEGEKQSAILAAEGEKQAVVLRAEGNKEAEIRTGEGHAGAIAAVYAAIHQGNPTPELLAVLQLDAIESLATSQNAKLVVPVETAGLLGAAQALRSVLGAVPEAGAPGATGNGAAPPSGGSPAR